jgi:hypothetical protein
MARHANIAVIESDQAPDLAIHLYHFWDVAHRIRLDPVVLHSTAKAMELPEEEETAFLNLQTIRATTELGKALQLQAWTIYHGAKFPEAESMLETRRDLIGPHSFEKLLEDYIAADQAAKASDRRGSLTGWRGSLTGWRGFLPPGQLGIRRRVELTSQPDHSSQAVQAGSQ